MLLDVTQFALMCYSEEKKTIITSNNPEETRWEAENKRFSRKDGDNMMYVTAKA